VPKSFFFFFYLTCFHTYFEIYNYGCGVSSLPLKYLGLPLGASFKAKSIWDGVIEKIECYWLVEK
jgi:hypothetical protein